MDQATANQISSHSGWLLNLLIIGTLTRSQLRHSIENMLLMSFFASNIAASVAILRGCPSYATGLLNLSSQFSLFGIVWKFTGPSVASTKQLYLGLIWTPIVIMTLLSNDFCGTKQGSSSVFTELSKVFVSTITFCLAILITYATMNDQQMLINRKKFGFLRLMAVIVFDSILMCIQSMASLVAPRSANSVLTYTTQFLHVAMTPLFFLVLHNGIRNTLIRLAKSNRFNLKSKPEASPSSSADFSTRDGFVFSRSSSMNLKNSGSASELTAQNADMKSQGSAGNLSRSSSSLVDSINDARPRKPGFTRRESEINSAGFKVFNDSLNAALSPITDSKGTRFSK